MSAAEVAQLEAAAETVVLTTTCDVPCPARPEMRTLRVALAESFTTRRPDPLVVKVVREQQMSKLGPQTVALMRDGTWTTDVGRGTLTPAQLAPIIAAFDAALIEAQPITEVGGRGRIQFIWPCARPSPTLAHALDLIYKALGQTSP